MLAKGEILVEETLSDELVVENHFDEVVGIIVEEDNSFPKSAWVFTNPINGVLPVFDQLHHKTS